MATVLPFEDLGRQLASMLMHEVGFTYVHTSSHDNRKWQSPPLVTAVEPLLGVDLNQGPKSYYKYEASAEAVVQAWNELIDLASASNIKRANIKATVSSVYPNFPFASRVGAHETFDSLAQYLYLSKDIMGNYTVTPHEITVGGIGDVPRLYLARRSIGCGSRHRIVGAMAETGRPLLTPIYIPVGNPKSAGRASIAVLDRLIQVFPQHADQLQLLFMCAVHENAVDALCRFFDVRHTDDGPQYQVELPEQFHEARRLITQADRHPGEQLTELLCTFFRKGSLRLRFGQGKGRYLAEIRSKHMKALAALEARYRDQQGPTEAQRMTEAMRKKGLLVT